MAATLKCLLILLCAASLRADDIDVTARKGVMLKFLREMVNQTKADTLNLPANASSIRENITDTFSCENRTYGYYADVDNECQVFHVCLTSQGSSGRNVTYRWSFICPNETVFNQEVLTCTRPRDSIDCEDSPMYYHLNMDIGKIPNDTEPSSETNKDKNPTATKGKRKPIRKQNIIIQNLMKEVVENIEKEDLKMDENMEIILSEMNPVMPETNPVIPERNPVIPERNPVIPERNPIMPVRNPIIPERNPIMPERNPVMPVRNPIMPERNPAMPERKPAMPERNPIMPERNPVMPVMIEDVKPDMQEVENMMTDENEMENVRLASERSLKRKGRKTSRGSFRFKADV